MNKKLTVLLSAVLVLPMLSTTMNSYSTEVQATEITTRRDIIVMYYKIKKGRLYQRPYNASKDRWEGKWTLA
ncbi:hypothetical protein [Xylocopilactobacillus apis]|uniref:Uncharacterized protein n=1 Tax=Xylocopilactobacillus apis TaxID=2932183 RepID=A0AAU9DFP4_9LACO|nr:hypothetical protein [Xylocopilactobacillus apis]BDR55527.1 hypothetical protein KIMC2_00890 [Xylocopilactobacillus apis]